MLAAVVVIGLARIVARCAALFNSCFNFRQLLRRWWDTVWSLTGNGIGNWAVWKANKMLTPERNPWDNSRAAACPNNKSRKLGKLAYSLLVKLFQDPCLHPCMVSSLSQVTTTRTGVNNITRRPQSSLYARSIVHSLDKLTRRIIAGKEIVKLLLCMTTGLYVLFVWLHIQCLSPLALRYTSAVSVSTIGTGVESTCFIQKVKLQHSAHGAL